MVEFFSRDEHAVDATSEGETILIEIDGSTYEVTRSTALALSDAIGDALTDRQEFFRTAGEYRQDGSYEISRRGADSAGNAKVFESFEQLSRLFDRLPDEIAVEDVGRTGITGSRRHMLIRHFAEHPSFECTITSRNPLTVRKTPRAGEAADDAADAPAD